MRLGIDIDTRTHDAILVRDEIDGDNWSLLGKLLSRSMPDLSRHPNCYRIPWRYFLVLRSDIARFTKTRSIKVFFLSDEVYMSIQEANDRSYVAATQKEALTSESIQAALKECGFTRKLTINQVNNLERLAPLYAGATFSVPGAGKTTEALAYFFLNAAPSDHLLVVAPKNAFGAWDEQLKECLPSEPQRFVRLRGGATNIDFLLRDKPRYMIITYQQFPRVYDLIRTFLSHHNVFMFLDESHRIKGGKAGISADAILNVSYLPKRKLILSGTPMPQSEQDLVPQFSFLYPEVPVSTENVVRMMQPVFVRTTSAQLGIPEVIRHTVSVKMSFLQEQVYLTLKSEAKRQLIPFLSDTSRIDLRKIGACVMKVIQFVSNPALLAKDLQFAFDPHISDLLLDETGPKIDYACRRARELAAEGRKVIIWSSFVENVELIAERLRDLGADYIHGGIDAGDDDELDTREWKIKEFHDNPYKMVLVANPAAASEGISLHRICQRAIYVDRTFNAAQYLQSEDRIHRLGLRPNQHPVVEIIECRNTIDHVITRRLEDKVRRMSEALNDASLNVDAVPYDIMDEMDSDMNLSEEDVRSIREYFFSEDDDK